MALLARSNDVSKVGGPEVKLGGHAAARIRHLHASDPPLHSPPTSGPHQGRSASLRDGLRPPLTRPLRQAPLLRYRVGG